MSNVHDGSSATRAVYSLAVAVEDTEGRVLAGLRGSDNVRDYRGFWSIPSTSVEADEYAVCVGGGLLTPTVLGALESRIGAPVAEAHLLISGERARRDYHLHQAVFRARLRDDPKPSTFKYRELRYVSVHEFLASNRLMTGTCTSLYFQALINEGRLPSTFRYFEVPPEIADGEIDPQTASAATLWRLAGPNYDLLLQGRTGTDGSHIRSLTLDRFVETAVLQSASKTGDFLDVGCGSGVLVAKAREVGADAWGFDLGTAPCPEAAPFVVDCDIETARGVLPRADFGFVLANLVLEWVPELDAALSSIRSCMAEGGRLLATFTPPEFSHAGDWALEGSDFVWIQRRASTRPRELVMVNRCVGPVWFHPRSTAQILDATAQAGFVLKSIDDIYLDSCLDEGELERVLGKTPLLRRHLLLPAFVAMEFVATASSD